MSQSRQTGFPSPNFAVPAFTLAELLIALAILGLIATFTIPKVLQAQQDQRFNAITKEAIGTISNAYTSYKRSNPIQIGFAPSALTPYMNYVAFDTNTLLDSVPGYTTYGCSSSDPCILLHNGARLLFFRYWFTGLANTDAVPFLLDPDGTVTTDGSAWTPGKGIRIFLYTTGRVATWGTIDNGTAAEGTTWSQTPVNDPSWFSWN